MATDRFLRFEYRRPGDASPWLHWSDEPASQVIEELREASEHGRFHVRALDADGTVVAELPVPTPGQNAAHRVRAFCDAWQRVPNVDPEIVVGLTQAGVDYPLLVADLRELAREMRR